MMTLEEVIVVVVVVDALGFINGKRIGSY